MKRLFQAVLVWAVLCSVITASAAVCVKTGEKIAFLGDSITQFGNRPDGYVGLVMNGLERSGVKAQCIPAGISGDKSNDMLRRLPGILKRKPDWLLLSCGVNDVGHGKRGIKLPEFMVNIRQILDQCAAAGVRVMILTPTLCRETLDVPFNKTLEGYCEFLRQEARQRQLPLADLNARMRSEVTRRDPASLKRLTVDNLHMNGYGNQMMAMGILEAMGVPPAELRKYQQDWNRLPSMAPIQNHGNYPYYKISINDYELLLEEAGKQGMPVQKLVWKQIEDYIASLRKKAAGK